MKQMIITLILALLVALAGCGKKTVVDEPVTGALTAPEYTMEISGRIARFQGDTVMLLSEEHGAIELVSDGVMKLEGLKTGDYITIYCNGLTKSIPAQATVVEMTLAGHGTAEDLPEETMKELVDMGYSLS